MKDIKLEIRGRKLLFDEIGTLMHIQDAVQGDPLLWLSDMHNRMKLTDEGKWNVFPVVGETYIYAYAGINSQLDVEDKQSISLESAKRWVRTLSFKECGEIINAMVEAAISMSSSETNGKADAGELITQPVS